MDTDCKFKIWMKICFKKKSLDELLASRAKLCLYTPASSLTLLSREKLNKKTLATIKGFLESLSMEEASEYVARGNLDGQSTLFVCRNVALLKIIIKYVPNINVKTTSETNALVRTCYCHEPAPLNLKKIIFLLDHGIDINAKDNNLCTALMHCCATVDHYLHSNIEEVIELLISRDADIHSVSANGLTPYDMICNKALLSAKSTQLLQGITTCNEKMQDS